MGEMYVSKVSPSGSEFRANYVAMRALVADLRAKITEVSSEGRPAALERHRKRGKLSARERLEVSQRTRLSLCMKVCVCFVVCYYCIACGAQRLLTSFAGRWSSFC